MQFELYYHADVKEQDLPQIDNKLKVRIRNAIETRLVSSPHSYGEPLRKTLKGYWKLRIGDYRVVYKIADKDVFIFGIIHRRQVYETLKNRT